MKVHPSGRADVQGWAEITAEEFRALYEQLSLRGWIAVECMGSQTVLTAAPRRPGLNGWVPPPERLRVIGGAEVDGLTGELYNVRLIYQKETP